MLSHAHNTTPTISSLQYKRIRSACERKPRILAHCSRSWRETLYQDLSGSNSSPKNSTHHRPRTDLSPICAGSYQEHMLLGGRRSYNTVRLSLETEILALVLRCPKPTWIPQPAIIKTNNCLFSVFSSGKGKPSPRPYEALYAHINSPTQAQKNNKAPLNGFLCTPRQQLQRLGWRHQRQPGKLDTGVLYIHMV